MQNPTSGVLQRTKWTRSVEVSARSPLKRGDFSSNRVLALVYWWSMIFSENRCPLFGIMLQWALGCARRGGAVFHFMLPLRELGPK